MFQQRSKGPEKKIKGVCYFSSSLIFVFLCSRGGGATAEGWGEGCTPSAVPHQRTGCCQGAVVLTWGKAPISRHSLTWLAQDCSQRCHSCAQTREGGNMARAKVEVRSNTDCPSDKSYCSGSHQEVLVRADIMISPPRVIEAKKKI